jgi:hypothetical protein
MTCNIEAPPALTEFAFGAQFAQCGFQFGSGSRIEAEGARDIALGNFAPALLDESNEFFAVRDRGLFWFFGILGIFGHE